jgi:hypothetical protein
MMPKKRRLVRNLLGEFVPPNDFRAKPKELVQAEIFDNALSDDLIRARKLAKQHREEGGKELF